MIILKKLKAGDLIWINHNNWTTEPLFTFKTLVFCSENHPKKLPKNAILTYIGDIKIIGEYKKRKYYGCLYDNQIIYISQYKLQSFKKINQKEKNNEL